MAYQNCIFKHNRDEANYEGIKLKLGSLRGVISMDIKSSERCVSVEYDDHFLTLEQLTRVLSEIGYQPAAAIHQ